jgi:hypothetical protein
LVMSRRTIPRLEHALKLATSEETQSAGLWRLPLSGQANCHLPFQSTAQDLNKPKNIDSKKDVMTRAETSYLINGRGMDPGHGRDSQLLFSWRYLSRFREIRFCNAPADITRLLGRRGAQCAFRETQFGSLMIRITLASGCVVLLLFLWTRLT